MAQFEYKGAKLSSDVKDYSTGRYFLGNLSFCGLLVCLCFIFVVVVCLFCFFLRLCHLFVCDHFRDYLRNKERNEMTAGISYLCYLGF